MENKMIFKGKTAVVTGGGGVLCSEFARALAASGAKVAVCDLRLEAAEAVAAEIRAEGGVAIGVAANVLQRESMEEARNEIEAKLSAFDADPEPTCGAQNAEN